MNALLDYEDIINRLTVEDMNALTTRVTPDLLGRPEKGFGVEVLATSTGLPVTVTLNTFEAQAAAASLESKWSDNKERCAKHRTRRRYAASLEPWKCTCAFVFWHNMAVHALIARGNELNAANQHAVAELRGVVAEMRDELAAMRKAS